MYIWIIASECIWTALSHYVKTYLYLLPHLRGGLGSESDTFQAWSSASVICGLSYSKFRYFVHYILKKTLHWNTTFLDCLLLDSPLKVPSGGFISQRWNWALLLPGSSELTPSQASQVNTWFLLNPLVHMYKYTTVISCRNYEPSGRPGTAWPVCDIHPLTHQSLGEWVSLFRNSVFIDGSVITRLRRLWRRTLRGCGIRRVAE